MYTYIYIHTYMSMYIHICVHVHFVIYLYIYAHKLALCFSMSVCNGLKSRKSSWQPSAVCLLLLSANLHGDLGQSSKTKLLATGNPAIGRVVFFKQKMPDLPYTIE